MTDQNNAAQAAENETAIEALERLLSLSKKEQTRGVKISREELRALLSKLRAEGVQAGDEQRLRRMLCVQYAGALAYMDDGEAQDARAMPVIDFLRDSLDEIERKMQKRRPAGALADPALQKLFGEAITGALGFGAQGVNPPPPGHWLEPFWQMARADAALERVASGLLSALVDLHAVARVDKDEDYSAVTRAAQVIDQCAALASAPVAGEAQKPVAWFIDWPDEPELGHYIAESPAANGRSRPLVFADAVPQPSEPVYAYRRKGLDDFVTCDRERFDELSAKPRLFETRIFYAAPQASEAVPMHKLAVAALNDLLIDIRAELGLGTTEGDRSILDTIRTLKTQADKDGAVCSCPTGDGSLRHPCVVHPDCAKGAGKWPMLSELHLHALMFAYNEGYSKAYDGRVFPNPFSENGSQAAAWQLGTDDGTEARAAQHPRTDGGGHGQD